MEDEIKKKLDNILFEIRWMQRNMNPPVNYSLIVVCSIIASAITTYIVLKLICRKLQQKPLWNCAACLKAKDSVSM